MSEPETDKEPVIFSLTGGSRPEPDVSNEQFIASYLQYGAWFRVLSTAPLVRVVSKTSISDADRLAATTAFYEGLGAFVEDTLTILVALGAWNLDKNRKIADLLERAFIRSGESAPAADYCDERAAALSRATTKRAPIDPQAFAKTLAAKGPEGALRFLGVDLTSSDSAVGAPAAAIAHVARDLITMLGSDRNSFLRTCQNKIKHGPQLVVTSLPDVIASRAAVVSGLEHLYAKPLVRLLLSGARTQERPGEVESLEGAAPFISSEGSTLRQMHSQMVDTAWVMYVIVSLAVPDGASKSVSYPKDPAVQRLVERRMRELDGL